ncbi:S-adenosylhomocysteine deaminase [Dissulfuribacter thermophilus]|uniref:5-methylthioadenosine/S-adenosylhomocysteine deaminase n=1 Tax=Dissulfuribacter thermophilus TaxID=1156395 RepID=A0A1B9F3R0_9BACT|nr:S-adenosylhomocysteine deaminase [Dissulfuribacter thermophilus]
MEPDAPPIMDGAIVVSGDRIESVGPREEILGGYTAEKIIERPTGLIIPGLVNAHTHVPMTLFRGLADDLPLKTWLEEHIFPREAKLTPELVSIGAELACAEMIRSGTTSFIDMYLFEDTICEVVNRVGMRAWLGEGLFDFPSPAFPSGFDALKETERLIEKWGDNPFITITIDPHTPYTCSPELLRAARKLQEHTGAYVVIHLAETLWEDMEIKKRYGCTPAKHLDNLGLLGERTIAVHVVHPTEEDISLLGERGVRVVHCPESNLKLASGISPVKDMIEKGIKVLIGTDGAASNNNLNMLEEMSTAAKIAKGVVQDPTALPAKLVMKMATTLSGESLGVDGLGTLKPGAPADVVIIELDSPHLRPCYNPVSQVVYCAGQGDVSDVICGGRILMEEFALKTIDEKELFSRLKRALDEFI